MDKKLTAVLVTAVFGLAACGGGGGGSGVITTGGGSTGGGGASSSGGASNSANSSSGSAPSANSGQSSTKAKEGTGVIYGVQDVSNLDAETAGHFIPLKDGELEKKVKLNNETIDVVEIDGRSIQMLPVGKSDASDGKKDGFYTDKDIYTGTSTSPYHEKPTKSWRMIGVHLKNARYGEIYDEYEKRHTVVVGKTTTTERMEQLTAIKNDKDKEAKFKAVKYTGHALHVDETPYFNAKKLSKEREVAVVTAVTASNVAEAANNEAIAAVNKAKDAFDKLAKEDDQVAKAAAQVQWDNAKTELKKTEQALASAREQLDTAREQLGVAKENEKVVLKAILTEKPVVVQSEFQVNFGNKTVVGTIKDDNNPDFRPINLKGIFAKDSDGETDNDAFIFGGKDTADGPNKGTFMKGSFYGENGEEIAGAYGNDFGHGTFGAAQDKK